jgi:hypothetical protein
MTEALQQIRRQDSEGSSSHLMSRDSLLFFHDILASIDHIEEYTRDLSEEQFLAAVQSIAST